MWLGLSLTSPLASHAASSGSLSAFCMASSAVVASTTGEGVIFAAYVLCGSAARAATLPPSRCGGLRCSPPRGVTGSKALRGGGGGSYDAFGLIGTIFRELDWKSLIFLEVAAPITPSAW